MNSVEEPISNNEKPARKRRDRDDLKTDQDFVIIEAEKKRRGVRFLPKQVIKRLLAK
jgi:hypothetical protein